MNIKNLAFSVMIVALIGLSMGFVGKSNSGITIVTPGGAGGATCSQGASQLIQCPSGTVVVGGGCNFVEGASAIEEFSPVFLPDQSVLCSYTCTDEGQNDLVEVRVSAICADASSN